MVIVTKKEVCNILYIILILEGGWGNTFSLNK